MMAYQLQGIRNHRRPLKKVGKFKFEETGQALMIHRENGGHKEKIIDFFYERLHPSVPCMYFLPFVCDGSLAIQ
jgi:hypothetical protein